MIFRRADRDPSDRARTRARVFVVFWSAVLLTVLLAFRAVLVPFIVALLLAYVLSPLVGRLTRITIAGRGVPRWGVVLALYAVMLSGISFAIAAAAPVIAGEVRDFARDEIPRLRTEFERRWLPRIRAVNDRFLGPAAGQAPARPDEGAPRDHNIHVERTDEGGYRVSLPPGGVRVERESEALYRVVTSEPRHPSETAVLLARARELGAGHTSDLVRVGRGIFFSVIGGIFGFFITLMLSAYILVTEDKLLGFARSLVRPDIRPHFDELLARIDRGLSGVVRGQLVICGVNGALSAVGFAIAGLKYWPVLALLAAVFSLVPIFGSILSSIPAVAVGLGQGLGTAVFVLAWIVGIHQIEANLLNPKIMGDAAKIHPVLVVFSLLAGEHFFGILGALLAVPVMSLVQSVFLHWRKYALSYGEGAVLEDSFEPPPPRASVPTAVRGDAPSRPPGAE